MQRSPRGRGTIELRGHFWWLRIREAIPDVVTGEICWRRVRIRLGSETALRTEAAARRAADVWIARRYPERQRHGRQILFAAAAERFLAEHVVLMRKSSRVQYQSVLRAHLVPNFASDWLHTIDTAAARAFMAKCASAGMQRATVANVRSVLLHLIRDARAAGFEVGAIDTRAVKVPHVDVAPVEAVRLSIEHVDHIIATTTPPWRALWAALGLLGLRISEALGLTWDVLELEGPEPVVHLRRSAAQGELRPLKTRTSQATLPLSRKLVEILQEHRQHRRTNPLGLLFASANGTPLRADNVRRRRWYPMLKQLEIGKCGLHAPRHQLPSRLFAAGASAEDVRRLMRHQDLRMTSRYSHSEARSLRAAMEAASSSRQSRPRLPHDATDAQLNEPRRD